MIQARIPDAILCELPTGAATAPLMRALRAGDVAQVPVSLVEWARRNGFDGGETVELLPTVVPYRPEIPRAGWWTKRRNRHWCGWGLICLSAALALISGFVFDGATRADPDMALGLATCLSLALKFWGFALAAPLLILLVTVAYIVQMKYEGAAILEGTMLAVLGLLGGSLLSALAGFALIARAKGLSSWLALLGLISLFVPDRNGS